MNKLTDKALKDYTKWLSDYSEKHHGLKGWIEYDNYLDEVELPETLQNALIIEWLDSVRIHILIDYIIDKFDIEIKDYIDLLKECKKYYFTEFDSRQKAVNKGIEKANLIYNEKQT